MTAYRFGPASSADLPRVYQLIDARIRWMDEKGIRQWNVTDYWGCYPPAHYQRAVDMGCMHLLRRENGEIVCMAVLWEEDPRWPEDGVPAYYVHHLVTALDAPGAGRAILRHCEAYAARQGKHYLRLDCAVDSPVLNTYYGSQGYEPAGECADGLYTGILRQKRV